VPVDDALQDGGAAVVVLGGDDHIGVGRLDPRRHLLQPVPDRGGAGRGDHRRQIGLDGVDHVDPERAELLCLPCQPSGDDGARTALRRTAGDHCET
jgi:hypothetical protein